MVYVFVFIVYVRKPSIKVHAFIVMYYNVSSEYNAMTTQCMREKRRDEYGVSIKAVHVHSCGTTIHAYRALSNA